MDRVTWADLDRGVEAGAASGFIVGTTIGIVVIVGFSLFGTEFLIKQQINPILVFVAAVLFSIIAVILLSVAGMVIGGALGMIFAVVYVKFPGKLSILKGIVLAIVFWPLFVFLALLRSPPHEQPFLASLLTSMLLLLTSIFYGTLHGVFWKKLAEPGRETYLRRVIFRRLTYRRIAYIIIILMIIIIVLALILAPIAKNIFSHSLSIV